MRFLPGFYDVFDDMFDDGWMSPSTNAMQCDIKEVDNNYEMNIARLVVKEINDRLTFLNNVGLGYLTLARRAGGLSGGEAQRIKLATELSKRPTGKTLYILDEPTTGLHMADVDKLIQVLQKLADTGNSIVVIEHNLDVIKTCDYIIDLGPEGGDKGGKIVATGTPEEVSKVEGSYTGKFLKKYFE